MKKRIFIIGMIIVGTLLSAAAFAADDSVSVIVDGVDLPLTHEPVIVNSRTMVPMRDIFENCYGAEVVWYEDTEIVTASLGEGEDETMITLQIGNAEMLVGDESIELDAAPELIDDKTMVPLRAVSEAFGSDVEWDEADRVVAIRTPAEENAVLDGTVISDEYRYENYDGDFNNVSIFDRNNEEYFGMERLRITDANGVEYADMISDMAESMPDVRVFCAVAPTAAEFYAAAPYRTNYLASISKIYNRLSPAVTPINLERALMENADEYIYFRTDHHWTQLGAYYAYREFCAASDNVPAELDGFVKKQVRNYLGSWIRMTADTDGFDMLGENPDTIEFYMPAVSYEGRSYSDMDMSVSPDDRNIINVAFGSYTSFLEGDLPLEVYHTEVDNGKSICIIKESFGNAFSTWLINNYENVYIVDYRMFNGNNSNPNEFHADEFCAQYDIDDLLVLSYPYTIAADDLRGMLAGVCAPVIE